MKNTITIAMENNVVIENITINQSIFDEEKVNFRLIERASMIDDLIGFIAECSHHQENDKALMTEDLEYLISLDDKYIFSSIVTNYYCAQSDNPEEFHDYCLNLLELNGMKTIEAKQLLMVEQPEQEESYEEFDISIAYEIKQYNLHFSDLLCSFGTFLSLDSAIKAMENGLEKLYPGFIKDVYSNGRNQWVSDKFGFGIQISEITLNVFEEL